MSATASIPQLAPGTIAAVHAPRPVVFVNDHPEPRLRVRHVGHASPLGTADVELDLTDAPDQRLDLLGQNAVIALPRTLMDGETRWEVLAVGRLRQATRHEGASRHDRRLTLIDPWSEALDASPAIVEPTEPTVTPETVGDALTILSMRFGLNLTFHLLTSHHRDAPLTAALPLDRPARTTLEALLTGHGLFVHRRIALHRSAVTEQRGVRPLELGRRIALPTRCRIGWHVATPARLARPWIARGARPRVESTFDLTPAWDPSLEGQPDTDYDRAQSSDFSRYGNVYRLWRLNDDATLAAEPLDLATLFDQSALSPTPIPFGDCLTLDDAGRPLPPIVEVSRDAGSAWSRFTDAVRFLPDRAGVVLDPATLDSATLAAAKSGDLRVRVTATLTSPEAFALRRWQGNPFAALGPAVRLDASALFKFQRVDPQSIHHDAVRNGPMLADEHDDESAMLAWLLGQLDRESRLPRRVPMAATLTLANARPELRVGDRLRDDFTADADTQPDRFATVTRVARDFTDRPTTTLTLRL